MLITSKQIKAIIIDLNHADKLLVDYLDDNNIDTYEEIKSVDEARDLINETVNNLDKIITVEREMENMENE